MLRAEGRCRQRSKPGCRDNYALYQIGPLARDLNGVAVGHALAYEDLVTGKADRICLITLREANPAYS